MVSKGAMPVAMQRARKDEDKQERRRAILDAARQLCLGGGIQALTMSGVAEAAGLAKGTLYLYFRTREELLLALLEELLGDWFAELRAGLGAPGPLDASVLAEALADSLERRPPLAALLAVLQSILEHNIELETARRFKRWLGGEVAQTGALLEARLPGLQAGEGAQLILQVNALLVGLYAMAEPSPTVRQALLDPELALLRVEFRPAFTRAVRSLITGFSRER